MNAPFIDSPASANSLTNSGGAPESLARASLERRWLAVHAAASAVQSLTQGGPRSAATNPVPAELRDIPAAVSTLSGARRQMAEDGIADLVAIMEPGLSALLAVHERGGDTAVPAQALWQEFVSARTVLVALALDRGI